MKRTQQQIEYEENEVTPAEQVTMASKQYKTVVENKVKKEKDKISAIKQFVLSDSTKKSEYVDIR